MNETQSCDWWREPEVRRSASGSYKAADCFSSTDYSNLDVQRAKGACDGQTAEGRLQCGGLGDFRVRNKWMRLEK